MTRNAGLICVALVAACCGGRGPTALAPVPETPPITVHASGTVLEEAGVPVEGATVVVYDCCTPKSAVTDRNGLYQMSLDLAARLAVPGVFARVTKVGYEDSDHFIGFAGFHDTSKDLGLYKPRRVTPGATVRLTLGPVDPLCGFEGEYTCRRVRITSPAQGMLALDAVPDKPDVQFGLTIGPITYGAPFQPPPAHLSVPVASRQEIVLDVLVYWGLAAAGSQAVTLNTALAPQ
jgi:hypothetical protein